VSLSTILDHLLGFLRRDESGGVLRISRVVSDHIVIDQQPVHRGADRRTVPAPRLGSLDLGVRSFPTLPRSSIQILERSCIVVQVGPIFSPRVFRVRTTEFLRGRIERIVDVVSVVVRIWWSGRQGVDRLFELNVIRRDDGAYPTHRVDEAIVLFGGG
jgi:hypothetical protein